MSLVHALEYFQAGFSVLPIKRDGSKAPALSSWEAYKSRLPREGEIYTWFDREPSPGVGIVGGEVSGGLFVLDFEFGDFFEEWSELVAFQRPGLLETLPIVRTPGKDEDGGRHVYGRAHASAVPTRKLARITQAEARERTGDPGRTTAVEVKAEKGYVLTVGCPPECHPTGRLYEHVAGPPIVETPTLAAADVDLLLSCARSLERGDRACADRATSPAPTTPGDRPGDDFNRRGDWMDEALGSGWHVWKQTGDVLYVTRPGKSGGVSATIGHCRSDLAGPKLYVFSTNAEPFESEKAYSKFEAYALLHHQGRFEAAARALAQRGYGSPARAPTAPTALARSNSPPARTGVPPDPGPATGYDVILEWFRDYYQPTFRRGNCLFSGALGREVKPGEACFAPGMELIERLTEASDSPRTENGPRRNAIPAFFRVWSAVAWNDLLRGLPDEEEAGEIDRVAGEEFCTELARAMKRQVTLGVVSQKGDERRELRSLIGWCQVFAKGNLWGSVRNYQCWMRLAPGTGQLAVAIRVELFSQIGCPEPLGSMTYRRFAALCEQYGVGRRIKVSGGEERAVELTPEFVADLLSAPALADGRTEGRDG